MLVRPIKTQDYEIQELLNENKRLLGICSAPASLISWLIACYSVSGMLDLKFYYTKQRVISEFTELKINNPQRINDPAFLEEFKVTYALFMEDNKYRIFYYDCARIAISALSSVTKPLTFNRLSLNTYQKFFPSVDVKPQDDFNKNKKHIEDLKKQNSQLEKIATRNISIARYSMLIIIPLAVYWMIFETETYDYPIDRIVDFIVIANVVFSILNLARENCIKDVKQAWNDRQLNLALAEAEKKIKVIVPGEHILSVNLNANTSVEKSTIDIIFKSKLAKKLVIKELIKSILMEHGINIVSSNYNQITLSAISINQTQDVEIEKIQEAILTKITMIEETEIFVNQIKRVAKANNMKVTCIPHYNNQGQRYIDCYFDSSSDNLRNRLSELFPAALITNLDNNIQISGNKPCDKETFNWALQAINHSNSQINSNGMFFNESQSHVAKNRSKTLRSVTKKLEQENEKAVIPFEKTTQSSLKRSAFQSGTYDPDNSKCKTTILSGNGLPYGRFYLTSSLTKNDFPDNDEAFAKFREKMMRSKKANARQNAEGIIFIDPVEVKCDNSDSPFVAEAKLKFKGAHGDMRVYMRKESNEDGEVLYIAEGVVKKAHK